MKSYYLTFLILLTCIGINFAQNPKHRNIPKIDTQVSGVILELGTHTPLEYATVIFKNKRNPKALTGGITNEKGQFNITVPAGVYTVSVEYIGFKTKALGLKKIVKNLNIGTIYLEADAEALDEVEIVAEKTTVEIKLDKKIYNVGKDLTAKGGTVSDVLDNVPSVAVDVEGNVSLRGNDNVRILINGKPSGLVGLNSTDALRQLPAESIEKVEVITSPSARYDSEGTAGILNIILRRSKLQGLNGAITSFIGYNPSAGISGNINYRTGNINIFNTSGYSYREVPGNSFTHNQYNAQNSILEETRTFDRVRIGLNTNFGIEWYINDSAALTASFLLRDSNREGNTTNNTKQIDLSNNSVITGTRFDPEIKLDNTQQYALNFTKNFETSGHKLTFDFQVENSDENENSLIEINTIPSEKVTTLENQERVLFQSDYTLPIGKNHQFEAGFKGTFNSISTNYNVQIKEDETSTFITNTNLSNLFNYNENLLSVYTQFGSKIGLFSYLLGLRIENTQITIDQPTSGDFSKRNYTGLFPTVNLTFKVSEKENITLGYARRLRRPRSYFINPFPSRSSVTNIFQGNPELDPSYSGQLDLGYLKRFGKFTFNASSYFSKATDVFSFISFDTGTTVDVNGQSVPVIRRTPINLEKEERLGVEFTLGYNPSRTWRINTNFNFFNSKLTGNTPNGQTLNNANTSWFARLSNKYQLPASIDWQTSLFYRGPKADAQNQTDGIFTTTMAFSKDLFKEKASLAFTVSDLFNSRKRSTTITTNTFTGKSEFQWRERSFNLSFTYRFNQKKKRGRSRNSGRENYEFEG